MPSAHRARRHHWSVKPLFLACACALGIAGLGSLPPQAEAYPPQVGSLAEAPVIDIANIGEAEQGVVRIDTRLDFPGAIGTGAGVVLSPDGIVLTNNHVVRGANDISVTDVANGKIYPADVLGYDRTSDIAVLQLRGAADLPVARLAGPATVTVGEPVTGLGFPDGGNLTRSNGVVRALDKSITAKDDLTGSAEELGGLIDYDADTRPGASGGPLVDDGGQVVGIVTAASQNYRMDSTGGFAIPIERATGIADAIRAGTASTTTHVGPTGILGVAIANDAHQSGILIRGVLRGGPAEQAGLTGGDVITAIDGMTTRDATALTDVLDAHHPGDTVTLTYLDGSHTPHSVPVNLALGPPN